MASSVGPNSCGTVTDLASIGTIEWTDSPYFPGSLDSDAAAAQGGNIAHNFATIGSNITSHLLKCVNFSFTVPSSAIIKGIKVEVYKKESDANLNVTDHTVQLLKADTLVGNNAASAGEWPLSFAYTTYGGEFDLWGTTWSAADINGSGFGVAIACTTQNADLLESAQIDHVRITAYYVISADLNMDGF